MEKDKSINKKGGENQHAFDHKRDSVEPEFSRLKIGFLVQSLSKTTTKHDKYTFARLKISI